MDLNDLEVVLKCASHQDTCWPRAAATWNEDNPAWGHCVMYALYLNECFGGEIIRVEAHLPNGTVISHYFNRCRGEDIDLSGSQFRSGTTFRARTAVTREQVLSLPDGERERYALFRAQVQKFRAVD